MNRNVTIYRSLVGDTAEYARANVLSSPTAPNATAPDLDDVVRFSFDRETWYDAEWDGDQWDEDGVKHRIAHLLMTDANLPASTSPKLYVRLTDNPEAPIVHAGTLTIL